MLQRQNRLLLRLVRTSGRSTRAVHLLALKFGRYAIWDGTLPHSAARVDWYGRRCWQSSLFPSEVPQGFGIYRLLMTQR